MPDFPHLSLINRLRGNSKPRTGRSKTSEKTRENLANKPQHGQALNESISSISQNWNGILEERKNNGLPNLPNTNTIPIYLQIEPNELNIEFLRGFGIEIISEEDEGYILGASVDGFLSLKDKVDQFVNHNKAKGTAKLWQIIVEGNIWRRDLILSKELNTRWDQISGDEELLLDIGVACYSMLSVEPFREKDESERKFNGRYERWVNRWRKQSQKRDDLIDERTNLLRKFVELYNGELLIDKHVSFPDSFCCRIKLNGIGLKDLVNTFQYVFEISEAEDILATVSQDINNQTIEATIIEPDLDSPAVCIIDSGILEGHKLLSPAIISSNSKSYVPGDNEVTDKVGGGGHGTKVAGAVLYGANIPRGGQNIKLPFFLLNARVLDKNNMLSKELYAPVLMEQVSYDFRESKIFNLSLGTARPSRRTHMSQWASTIDKLMFENQILFIVSAGNINPGLGHLTNPGINHHLNQGKNYPNYLFENSSHICDPAQSCFALTVGSVCHSHFDNIDWKSFGKYGDPSAFTRTGPGLWGIIKPDVVEFGGDYIVEKTAAQHITLHADTSPELVKSRINSIGKDDVGTSFSAPKVSHIAAMIQKQFPQENALMYRALIAQSARHPNDLFKNPSKKLIESLGYGIPELDRAIMNTRNRITFIANDKIAAKQAHIYKINLPQEVNRPGDDYDILVEITLSYFANPRRTRKGTRSYLSSWLDWETSRLNDSEEEFKKRILQEINLEESAPSESGDGIDWKIGNRINNGVIGVRRQDGTLQKDWAIIKSNQLPNEFCIAIVGHKGWDNKISTEIPYALTISFEVLNPENEIELYQLVQTANIEVQV